MGRVAGRWQPSGSRVRAESRVHLSPQTDRDHAISGSASDMNPDASIAIAEVTRPSRSSTLGALRAC
jgi:hypothetical protein